MTWQTAVECALLWAAYCLVVANVATAPRVPECEHRDRHNCGRSGKQSCHDCGEFVECWCCRGLGWVECDPEPEGGYLDERCWWCR